MCIVKRCMLLVFTILLLLVSTSEVSASKLNRPVYNSGINECKKIALTFDDGPHPKNTPKILEILDKYDIKATFFVIGVNVKNYPKTLSMIKEQGHEIGNHTYSHHILKSKAKDEILREISETEKEIGKITDFSTSLVRPPCGMYDENLVEIAKENNYKIVLWNVDTKDWEHLSCDEIVSNVTKRVNGGEIILFHDYISGINNTPRALEVLIPWLKEQGYEFVTVSQLLQ